MRTLKFRILNKPNKQEPIKEELSINFPSYVTLDQNIENFQQFTGKLDKNNVEIYEHDIVRYANDDGDILLNDVWEVIWDKSACAFILVNNLYDRNLDIDSRELEVIGNILETPEKLK